MSLIYTNIYFSITFVGIFLLWSASELLGPARWHGSDTARKRDRGSVAVIAAAAAAGVVLAFLCPILLPAATMSWPLAAFLFFLGTALVGMGTWLRWSAIRTLGHYFTGQVMIQGGQRVVRHGLYKRIRHPSYTGILLVVIGLGFMITNWASLLTITAGMLGGLLYRIKVEEEELLQTLEGYTDYMQQTTKRLIPFIF